MKTIKDAVIALDGRFPDSSCKCTFLFVDPTGFFYAGDSTANDELVCTRTEFESESKRLGYINGYRWGVEYPTNGKRPDLDDRVFVDIKFSHFPFWNEKPAEVDEIEWCFSDKFKITDPRYKPADTSYLNAPTQAQSLTHSEEGLVHKADDEYKPIEFSSNDDEVIAMVGDIAITNSAMHYNSTKAISEFAFTRIGEAAGKLAADMVVAELSVSHSSIDGVHAGDQISIEGLKRVSTSWFERGEWPPIGVECELWHGGEFRKNVEFLCVRGMDIVFWDLSCNKPDYQPMPHYYIKPIRTEREKVIEAAFEVLLEKYITTGNAMHGKSAREAVEALYSAGMLVLSPKKSDTED